jgi:hypothetical protein
MPSCGYQELGTTYILAVVKELSHADNGCFSLTTDFSYSSTQSVSKAAADLAANLKFL